MGIQHLLTYLLLLHTMPLKSTMSPPNHMLSNMVFLTITPEITSMLKRPKVAMLLAGHTKSISPTAVSKLLPTLLMTTAIMLMSHTKAPPITQRISHITQLQLINQFHTQFTNLPHIKLKSETALAQFFANYILTYNH